MKLDENTFEKWKKWTALIEKDLINNIVNDKKIHNDFINMINSNIDHIERNHGRLFCDHIRKWYASNVATGIRRHMFDKKGEISLMRLMRQIRDVAKQFTFDRYLEFYPIKKDQLIPWQQITFSDFSEDGEVVSDELIDNDIQTFENISRKVSDYVDRKYAHLDKHDCLSITFNDLSKSVELLDKLFCKYKTLLTGKGLSTLEATIQFDHMKIFKVPFDIRDNK